jgi:hypothetical protein
LSAGNVTDKAGGEFASGKIYNRVKPGGWWGPFSKNKSASESYNASSCWLGWLVSVITIILVFSAADIYVWQNTSPPQCVWFCSALELIFQLRKLRKYQQSSKHLERSKNENIESVFVIARFVSFRQRQAKNAHCNEL